MNKAEILLKTAGLRITSHRVEVVEYLLQHPKPVNLYVINKHFQSEINRITLYRILNDLAQAGLIKVFYGQDGQKYVEKTPEKSDQYLNQKSGHFHFQCHQCDTVFCLDDIQVLNLPDGFNLSMEQSILIGMCEKCV